MSTSSRRPGAKAGISTGESSRSHGKRLGSCRNARRCLGSDPAGAIGKRWLVRYIRRCARRGGPDRIAAAILGSIRRSGCDLHHRRHGSCATRCNARGNTLCNSEGDSGDRRVDEVRRYEEDAACNLVARYRWNVWEMCDSKPAGFAQRSPGVDRKRTAPITAYH
jgi:hypothetical protein